jgi:hypothetical protein
VLNEALRKVVGTLDELRVPYALIGGLAVAAHGVMRATKDIDLLVDVTVQNAPTFAQSLRENSLDATLRRGDVDDPIVGVIRVVVSSPAAPIKCDILLASHRWQAAAVANALPVDLGGFTVRVAQPLDLFLLKLYAGGPLDLDDAAHLLELQSEKDRKLWKEKAVAIGERDAFTKCQKLMRNIGGSPRKQ